MYDPQVLTISPIKQGDFFPNAVVLLEDTKNPGKITYMIGLTPVGAKTPRTGTGTVASFTVSRKATAPTTGSTTLGLENVYVAADDLKKSVLKNATGTTVTLS